MIKEVTREELNSFSKIHPEVDFIWNIVADYSSELNNGGESYMIDAMCLIPMERQGITYYGTIRKMHSFNRSTLKDIKEFCDSFEEEVERMKTKGIVDEKSENMVFYKLKENE